MYYNNPEVVLKTTKNEVFLTLEYDSTNKYAYSNWLWQYEYGVEYIKEGGEAILDFMKKHKFDRLLNDNCNVEGIWDEANKWIEDEWIPQMVQAGLRKMAHISSQELFAQLSAEIFEDSVQRNEDAFQLRMFNNQEAAEKWLLEH